MKRRSPNFGPLKGNHQLDGLYPGHAISQALLHLSHRSQATEESHPTRAAGVQPGDELLQLEPLYWNLGVALVPKPHGYVLFCEIPLYLESRQNRGTLTERSENPIGGTLK